MDSGFYSSFAAFSTRLDALEVLANNLANSNTPGFKAQHEFYRSLPEWLQASFSTPLNDAVNQMGVLSGTRIDLSTGTLEKTDNPTDVALEGEGFFAIQTANGVRYTRNGAFSLNTDRQLVTSSGELVLGEQGPIQVPNGQINISADGTVSVDGTIAGQLQIRRFDPATQLLPEGNTKFQAPAGSDKPAGDPRVRQGAVELSNSDPARSAVALIDLQRTAQLMEKALYIFHNEFNRTAAQELSRV